MINLSGSTTPASLSSMITTRITSTRPRPSSLKQPLSTRSSLYRPTVWSK